MKFIDEIIITIMSGNGGNGCLSYLKLKNSNKRLPNGGKGGHGGNVYFEVDSHLNNLFSFSFKQLYIAHKGTNGKKYNCNGKTGKDLILKVPLGTKITNLNNNNSYLLIYTSQKILIAEGGKAGLGNNLVTKTKVSNFLLHKQYLGKPGIKLNLLLELTLLADIGLLGLPNAGKSSLLKTISNTNPKIDNYPFTTLVPKLGTLCVNHHKFVIADIPGIIKDANKGKGLGIKFLKHLMKCKILLHVLDISKININIIIKEINIVLIELKKFDLNLFYKPRWLIFNKIDLVPIIKLKQIINHIIKIFKNNYKIYLPISTLTEHNIYKLIHKFDLFIK